MSDVVHFDNDGDPPVNPYSLLEAVNRSSDMAHVAWLIFLAIMAYLMIAVAGVSHEDLLLEKDVQLPILNVPIPLIQFFQFAPILLLLFHLGLIAQLVLLARKTLELDISVRHLEPSSRRTHPLRLELHNFFFVQGIAGPHRSIIMGLLLHSMSWLTLAILPVVLMGFIQLSFLPYHGFTITWMHRIVLVLDITMLTLIGVFLMRAEANFFQAFWRTGRSHPISFLVTMMLLIMVALFSFFVATIPGENLDKNVRKFFAAQQSNAEISVSPLDEYAFTLPMMLWGSNGDGSLFGFFHRRLIVSDLDLVTDREVTPNERSLSLRERDLRFAMLDRSDLHQADMTGANLNGASLINADLRGIRLGCQDKTKLFIEDDRLQAKCASARGANFSSAKLDGAMLTGLDLSGAKLKSANLNGTSLQFAILQGANLSSANLRKADLSGGIQAQGATFTLAQLQGANLNGGQLQLVDFSSAQLQGAWLSHAHLEGTVFNDADLSAASLNLAWLNGADMSEAILHATDMRKARIWMTLPPQEANLNLANMSQIQINPLNETDRERLKDALKSIDIKKLQGKVASNIKEIILSSKASSTWESSDEIRSWQKFAAISLPENIPDYPSKLSSFLAKLACQAYWSDGAVAKGVVQRAIAGKFVGDLPALYARLTTYSVCKPAKDIEKRLMQSFTANANTEQINQ